VLLPGRGEPGRLLPTLAGAVASRRLRLGTIQGGTLHALGVDFDEKKPAPDPDGVTVRPLPPCMFCAFGRLCGLESVA
jgi:hypothetical protein